jgi:hypothetical protein
MHVFELEFRFGAGDHRAIRGEHAAAQDNFTVRRMRLPHILRPSLRSSAEKKFASMM